MTESTGTRAVGAQLDEHIAERGEAEHGLFDLAAAALIVKSQTCAHDDPAGFAPSRPTPRREHRAGGVCGLAFARIRVAGQAAARHGRAVRPACGPCGAPAPRPAVPCARPCAAPWRRWAPSTAASPNPCCRSPAGAPAQRPAAPVGAPAHAPPPCPRAVPERGPQRSDLRVLRLDNRPQPRDQRRLITRITRQTGTLRAQAPSMLNLSCRFKHQVSAGRGGCGCFEVNCSGCEAIAGAVDAEVPTDTDRSNPASRPAALAPAATLNGPDSSPWRSTRCSPRLAPR
jgi:hypothetical protein